MKIKALFAAVVFSVFVFAGCGENTPAADNNEDNNIINAAYETTGSMPLDYADQFSVAYCADGCSVITVGSEKYLLVPDGQEVPVYADDMTVICQPVGNIYNAASSAMDLFDALGKLDSVTMTSTNTNSWSLPSVVNALSEGKMTYIGKYSAPDYEMLASENCGLAVESTMIYHTPHVKEQIESLGIPVLTERSSYEAHPLGRMEWIKLYGLILGVPEKAEQYFDEKTKAFRELQYTDIPESEMKTAAFFSVNSNGFVNIRKPGDYVSKMIELAGGRYIFTAAELGVEDNALSTMNIQFETFYNKALNADILIYNSTIEGKLDSIDRLIEKNSLFADFKAVKNGDVWCTEQNTFQQTTGAADMISDLAHIFSGEAEDELEFLYRLK